MIKYVNDTRWDKKENTNKYEVIYKTQFIGDSGKDIYSKEIDMNDKFIELEGGKEQGAKMLLAEMFMHGISGLIDIISVNKLSDCGEYTFRNILNGIEGTIYISTDANYKAYVDGGVIKDVDGEKIPTNTEHKFIKAKNQPKKFDTILAEVQKNKDIELEMEGRFGTIRGTLQTIMYIIASEEENNIAQWIRESKWYID